MLKILLIALVCAGLMSPGVQAQEQEASVKAAFIFNFIKFTDWPLARMESSPVLQVCILSVREPLRAAMGILDGKTALGRGIKLRTLDVIDSIDACHVLVLGEIPAHRPPALHRLAQARSILTIGESEGFIDAGGMIGLLVLNDKVRFEINLEAVRNAGLNLSAQLLRLALRVKGVS
ncbi:MAG: YfiR family protein [Rhodocyclaceae bacterium]|nr:YfiR family protein [Rhodocyclaceae bacterium]